MAREGEGFVDGDTPSTKAALATLRKLTEATKVLVVLADEDRVNWLSLRNEPTVHLLEAGQLNTYDVLLSEDVIFTSEALD
ncbi:MAG: 50S ribosomal protein L4, partial [Gemmatimonadetes bacterium]|nr:50S ribosomal protein L4 [Gemmatimonadota bacterium]